ncbi:MAG: exo-alpha-sialidase [Nitrosopumilus sp.]|nr:exo-alpha-sialidase [Nitrosopumilus sp.]
MKTKITIIVCIVAAVIIFSGFYAYSPINDSEIFGPKNQYKFWQEELDFGNGMWHTRALFSYSHDYGKTFSAPSDMSMTNENAHEPKMIVMDDDVILVWRDEVEDDSIPNISFAKSTDFGETFEKKRVFHGARPDIKQYDDVLYLTWAGPDLRQIWYSVSTDKGETFSEPSLIFAINWELSPYDERPTPTLDVYSDGVVVSWKMRNPDDKSEPLGLSGKQLIREKTETLRLPVLFLKSKRLERFMSFVLAC